MATVHELQGDKHAKGNTGQIDLATIPKAQAFFKRCQEFLNEIQNLTPGKALEKKLNSEYGPGTPYFDDFTKFMLEGLDEGWVAFDPITGPEYRRSRLCTPSAETRFLSITTVYMESSANEEFLGDYHKHPYGEINAVIPVTPGAELMGMQGWQGPGWTSPGAGTHHFPQVKGGGLISLFFLPAGRITYDAKPGEPQPASV